MIAGVCPEIWDFGILAGLVVASATLVRGMIVVGIMDVPGGRKAHARPTPKGGGVGVMGACLLGLAVFSCLHEPWMLAGLIAASGLGLVGLADDVRDRGVLAKLGAQCLAAMLVVCAAPSGWGGAGGLVAALWLVGVTNMFNFMDGLDGLAGGTGLVAATCVALAAPAGGATQIAALALAAGLAGFLPFNLPPARIFLGDAGSQFCGFLLGVLGLRLAVEPAVAGGGWLLPMVLSAMIFDVSLTLARRAWAGAPIATAHREHLYQRIRLPAGLVSLAHAAGAGLGGIGWFLLGQGALPITLAMLGALQAAWIVGVSRCGRTVAG